MVTERPLPGGGTTTLGGGTAISGGGTPDTGGGTPFRPVPAEFNHCIKHPVPDRVKLSFVIFDIRAL